MSLDIALDSDWKIQYLWMAARGSFITIYVAWTIRYVVDTTDWRETPAVVLDVVVKSSTQVIQELSIGKGYRKTHSRCSSLLQPSIDCPFRLGRLFCVLIPVLHLSSDTIDLVDELNYLELAVEKDSSLQYYIFAFDYRAEGNKTLHTEQKYK